MSDTESDATCPSKPGPVACPRLYQSELLEEAKRRNIIIRADTGTGKTLVAVLLIDWMAAQPKPDAQRHVLQAFLVPTRPLVQQQAKAVRTGTGLRVREYTGDVQELWNVDKWSEDLQETDVIVCTAQIFYDILSKGIWSLEDVSLLVFDEAHHCRKGHVYKQIMQVHFRRLAQDPNHRRVPKILGLTASPIWDCVNMDKAEKDIRGLQSDLSAQLYEIKESREDVNQYTHKPKENIVYFTPVTFVDPFLEPQWEQVRILINSHADEKFLQSLRTVQEELGQYALFLFISDWLSSLLSLSTNNNKNNTTDAINPRLLEPTYRQKVKSAIKSLELSIDPNDVPLSQTTPKFQALTRILEEYSKSDHVTSFQGMIFVERRRHAQLLHRLISRCVPLKGFIKSSVLTGHASGGRSGCDIGMDSKAQNRAVEKFRKGEVNLAIATNVAEEGLDFRACRAVIRFDDIKTWKGYIQSRGRARAANSDYVVMLPEGTDSKYLQFVGKESELETNLYGRPDDECIDDAALESTSQLVNELGGGKDAILTHAAAVSLLNEVCQLLPHDEYAELPKPRFEDIQRPDGFICRVTLPPMPALPSTKRVFESDTCAKKKAAKQSAAFNACNALREAGVLDDHFMPQRERHSINTTDADGRNLSLTQLPEKVEVICPNPFGNPRTTSSEIWLHKLSFDVGEPKPSAFGFLCAQELVLPAGLVIYDHAQGGKPLPIIIESTVKMGWTPEERSENIKKLEAFTRMGMQAAINRRVYEGDLLFFVAPLVEDSMEIDWKLIENPLTPITSVEDLSKYNELIVPVRCLHHRIFTSYITCPELTAESLPSEVPAHPNLHRFISNAEKFKSLGHFYIVIEESLRAHLKSPLVYLESSFVASDNLAKDLVEKPFTPFRVLLPSTACKGSHLPSHFWRLFSFLPALTRRIHDTKQVESVLERLSVPHISLDLATEALTPPGVDVPYDYQTLETVGDAFLKLATSVHVYLSHVKKGEGDMSSMRSKSVDNEYLRSKSVQAGLGGNILSYRYRTDRFKAAHMDEGRVLKTGQFQRKIPRRVLSDVVEALLGAAYLSDGLDTALKIGTALDLCFGGTAPWSQRVCTVHANMDGTSYELKESHLALQELIGYTFKQPLLLIQALTHRSSGSFVTDCYEREEWLGDAILDFWIIEHCYRRWEKPTAGQLTLTRSCLVTNASLGYLSLKKLGLRKLITHGSEHFERVCDEVLKEIAGFTDVGSFYQDLKNPFVIFDPPKILGDVLEALVGAIFIDCGMDLPIVYKCLDKIYEDVLPHLHQVEPRDPLSELLRLRDEYRCAELRRVSRQTAQKTGKDDDSCQSVRMCDITLHGQLIATGQHPTSSNVAEQRACLNAYEILNRSSDTEGTDARPNPWLKCSCQATLTVARTAAKAKKHEEKIAESLSGKANKRKRIKQNRKLRQELARNDAAGSSQPISPVKEGEMLDKDESMSEESQVSDLSDDEAYDDHAEEQSTPDLVESCHTQVGDDSKPSRKAREKEDVKPTCESLKAADLRSSYDACEEEDLKPNCRIHEGEDFKPSEAKLAALASMGSEALSEDVECHVGVNEHSPSVKRKIDKGESYKSVKQEPGKKNQG